MIVKEGKGKKEKGVTSDLQAEGRRFEPVNSHRIKGFQAIETLFRFLKCTSESYSFTRKSCMITLQIFS